MPHHGLCHGGKSICADFDRTWDVEFDVGAHGLGEGDTAAAEKRAQRLGQESVLAREENGRALSQAGRLVRTNSLRTSLAESRRLEDQLYHPQISQPQSRLASVTPAGNLGARVMRIIFSWP
jgi:hypothetical protein